MRPVPLVALGALVLTACQDERTLPTGARPHAAPRAIAAAAAPSFARSAADPEAGDVIPGRWIVLLEDRPPAEGMPIDLRPGDAAGGGIVAPIGEDGEIGPADPAVARVGARVREGRGTVLATFQGGVAGFSVEMSEEGARALRADPSVAGVEPDRWIEGTGTQTGVSWALDRVDQRPLPLDGAFRYAGDGTGVQVYVFDTGILSTHTEFGGRVERGMDFVTSGGTAADCHGHGTLTASLVAGRVHGVAKGARVVPVRVLGCNMSGSLASAMNGLSWVIARKKAAPRTPMVVSMSLAGSGGSMLFDRVATMALDLGITIVASSGNAGANACNASPARIPGVLTVGAVDAQDRHAGFSNSGSCVDVAAPGVAVTGAWIGSTAATFTASGTSVSAPLVAGVAATYLSSRPSARAAEVHAAIVGAATAGRIGGLPAGTPNRLLFAGW